MISEIEKQTNFFLTETGASRLSQAYEEGGEQSNDEVLQSISNLRHFLAEDMQDIKWLRMILVRLK